MRKQPEARTNSVILNSIPIDRKVKRYWVSKFKRIAANCGVDEAVGKMKNLSVQIRAYLADSNRHSNRDRYLSSTGFRNNGMLRKLFEQADCQPHFVLSFVKLFSAEQESTQSDSEAAEATHRRMTSVKANEALPRYLTAWLECVFSRHGRTYGEARRDSGHPFHRYAAIHSYDEWHAYWTKWYSVLRRGWTSPVIRDDKPVFPEVYKDYVADRQSSRSYDRDFAELTAMHYLGGSFAPLSEEQLEFVDRQLSDEVRLELLTNPGSFSSTHTPSLGIESSLLGFAVGQVQHIHKKGGGTELRDIAVPNRFIQQALVPAAARLYKLVRCLPQDATFDQSRFDTKIQNRVNNRTLYQGSVDLSKATDNLPLAWGRKVVTVLIERFWESAWIVPKPTSEDGLIAKAFASKPELPAEEREVWDSLDLFWTIARAKWEDGSWYQEWKVGQPLGSLPSFAMLAITHNLLVESLALSQGLGHSPYVILGDDIVILNRKLRSRYIRELTSRSIPLSLHKSFSGRLSEFAGKIYVSGCVPFYISDHNPLTWNSLLDWQRTTGIRIPWENLPKTLRSKIKEMARESLRSRTGDRNPSTKEVVKLAYSAYALVQTCEVHGRGSHLYPVNWDSAGASERIIAYGEYRITDSPIPEAVKHSGLTLLGERHPVTLLSDRFADKNGWFLRFRPVELPSWYRSKVRPVATDAALSAAMQAIDRKSVV